MVLFDYTIVWAVVETMENVTGFMVIIVTSLDLENHVVNYVNYYIRT